MKRLAAALIALLPLGASSEDAAIDGTLRMPHTGKYEIGEPTAQASAVAAGVWGAFDHSTGRATVTAELCRLEGDGLAVAVTLAHTTGGLKVDAEDGPAGVAWSLHCGGFVSRSVVGRPDEEGTFRHWSTKITDKGTLHSMLKGETDTGADRYAYQAGAFSGQFIFDAAGAVLQLPDNGVRITRSQDGASFTIVTPDGCRYEYSAAETVELVRKNPYHTASGIVRNPSYGPVTRTWALRRITNPQGTDSMVFGYRGLPDRREAAVERTWSVGGERRSGDTEWAAETAPQLPTQYGETVYRNRSVVASVKGRAGSITLGGSGEACESVVLSAPGGAAVQSTALGYRTVAMGRQGKQRLLLVRYVTETGGYVADAAGFEYYGEGLPMYSKDFFGYCNGTNASNADGSRSVLGVLAAGDNGGSVPDNLLDPVTGDSRPNPPGIGSLVDHLEEGAFAPLPLLPAPSPAPAKAASSRRLSLSWERRSSAAGALVNALHKVRTSGGLCLEYEYEPNRIEGGWEVLGDVLDMTIGLRVRRETASDENTGDTRVREFEYGDPVPLIDFRGVGISPFVSVGGGCYEYSSASGVPLSKTYTTGASALSRSRLAGAPLEDNAIYYGTVVERTSGTGLAAPLYSRYTHDTRHVPLRPVGTDPRTSASDPMYCGTMPPAVPASRPELAPLMGILPMGKYYRERLDAAAPLAERVDYRTAASGDTVPARVTRYVNTRTKAREAVTGYLCESLVRTAQRAGGIETEEFRTADDFEHCPVRVSHAVWHTDSVIVTDIAADGSSRTVRKAFIYNDSIPGGLADKPADGFRPFATKFTPSRVPNSHLRYEETACAGDTVSVEYLHSADYGDLTLNTAAAGGWTALPVKRVVRSGGAAFTDSTWYGAGQVSSIRPRAEVVLGPDGAEAGRTDIEWTASGRPSKTVRNHGPNETYKWSADGVHLLSRTVAGRLTTEYTHTPLAGPASVKSPWGATVRYAYEGRLLKSESVNGTTTRTHAYSNWHETGSAMDGRYAASTLAGVPGSEVTEVEYLDAFGRRAASARGSLKSGALLASYVSYDAAGRPARIYTPMPVAPGEAWRGGADHALDRHPGERPYEELSYPPSADSRPSGRTLPGNSFRGHPSKTERVFNTTKHSTTHAPVAAACLRYSVTAGGLLRCDGLWPDGALEAEHATDADGRETYVFTDFRGRVVLERAVLGRNAVTGRSPDLQSGVFLDTYYVYDGCGLLRYALPPMASKSLTALGGTWRVAGSQALGDYAYVYDYDSRMRLVSEKAPGREAVTHVYDKAGTPVLSQDGNQRARGVYAFAIPDDCGRPALRGECSVSGTNTAALASAVAAATRSSGAGAGLAGYIVNVTLGSPDVHAATYYDDYSFLTQDGFAGVGAEVGKKGAPAAVPGLRTGELARVLDGKGASEAKYLASATLYDARGRVSYRVSSSHRGGCDVTAYAYDNADRLLSEEFSGGGSAVKTEYAYDAFGRPSSVTVRDGDGKTLTSSSAEYDGEWRLKTATLGTAATLGYSHDIRGALTSVTKGGSRLHSLSYSGSHSGLVTGETWRDAGGFDRSYAYTYDKAARLTAAKYSESGRSAGADYSAAYLYDLNSNPTGVTRMGLADIAAASGSRTLGFGLVDDLEIAYAGNRPVRVDDLAESPVYSGASDFAGLPGASGRMSYDANGNLVSDPGRGVESIEYNALGLPQSISFSDGSWVRQTYSADGALLRRQTRERSSAPPAIQLGAEAPAAVSPADNMVRTEDYRGPFVYEGYSTGGLVAPSAVSRTYTAHGFVAGGTPYYHICDRRGSVRQVVNGTTGQVERQYHYYPYGALFGECAATALQSGADSRRRFEGKEQVSCAGVSFLDYPARPYDPLLLQFWTDDPLCEKYPRFGPRLYCGANPVNSCDPTGMIIIAHGEDAQTMIKNTLPKDSHNCIVFGNNGILNNDLLSDYSNLGNSANYMSLYTMSSSDYVFEVNLNDFLYYFDENNSFDFEYLRTIDIDSDASSEGMYLRTGEYGWVGHIAFPGKDRKYNSTNNNIQITIHKDLSPNGKAQAFSHEAYGHGYLYVKTNGDKHLSMHQREGMTEKNRILYDLINQAINETIKNMSK